MPPSLLLVRGNRSLPFKWHSHSSAARPVLERAHGWASESHNLSRRHVCQCAGRGPVRVRVWAYCRVALALRYLPIADRRVDHRIWTLGARLFGLEASSCARLEQTLAVCDRGGPWRSNWRNDPDLGQSCARSCRRRHLLGCLQSVCAFPTGHGSLADVIVGFLNGVLAGVTGLAGI